MRDNVLRIRDKGLRIRDKGMTVQTGNIKHFSVVSSSSSAGACFYTYT